MSYLEIYQVAANGDVTRAGEAHNAFGGAMHIWQTLADKYRIPVSFMRDDGFSALWKAWPRMTRGDAWVMRGTFDHVIIPPEALPTYLAALRQFTHEHPTATLNEALAVLDELARDPTIRGVCFNQTSVNADAWHGPYDEAAEDYTPYNIDRDSDHWFLTAASFEEVDATA